MKKAILAILAAMILAAASGAQAADGFSRGCEIYQGSTLDFIHTKEISRPPADMVWFCDGVSKSSQSIFGQLETSISSLRGVGVSEKTSYTQLCLSTHELVGKLTDAEAMKMLYLLGVAAQFVEHNFADNYPPADYANLDAAIYARSALGLAGPGFTSTKLMVTFKDSSGKFNAAETNDPRANKFFGALLSGDVSAARRTINSVPDSLIYGPGGLLPFCRAMTGIEDGKQPPEKVATMKKKK